MKVIARKGRGEDVVKHVSHYKNFPNMLNPVTQANWVTISVEALTYSTSQFPGIIQPKFPNATVHYEV